MNAMLIFIVILSNILTVTSTKNYMVLNTWAFNDSTQAAWNYIKRGFSAVDALEIGCMTCERLQCDGTVGYGGSPDESGETTLDAMIFDGTSMNMGAVGALRRVKDAVSVAKHVLQHTTHSLLVGDQATSFAEDMGFTVEDIGSKKSRKLHAEWKANKCQPNYWIDVKPDSKKSCGPYRPLEGNDIDYEKYWSRKANEEFKQHNHISINNHDTIGMITIDSHGNIAAGTSTNGMIHKIPGRVGDSPIPGAGAYADSSVGAAAATGDGDIMMRFLPSFLAVEQLRLGITPQNAAKFALNRIIKYYPKFFGGIIVANKRGDYGAACNGMESFPFTLANNELGKATIFYKKCK